MGARIQTLCDLQCGRHELVECLAVQCADALSNNLSTLEKQQGGDVPNVELARNGLVVVDVDLADAQSSFVVTGHLVQDWRNGLAGAAPCGPEVDEDGDVAVEDVACEVCIGGVCDQFAAHCRFLRMDFYRVSRHFVVSGCSPSMYDLAWDSATLHLRSRCDPVAQPLIYNQKRGTSPWPALRVPMR